MKILDYREETTRGADPTQIETWECESDRGTPFTVTQFFGDYLIQFASERKTPAPAAVAERCREHARAAAEFEQAAYDHEVYQAECAAGWDPNP